MRSTVIAAYIAALAGFAIAGHHAVTSSDELLDGCPNGYVDKDSGECKPFTVRMKRSPYGPWENHQVHGAYHLPGQGSSGGAKPPGIGSGLPWGMGLGPVVNGPPKKNAGRHGPASSSGGRPTQHNGPVAQHGSHAGSYGLPAGYGGAVAPEYPGPGMGGKKHHGSKPSSHSPSQPGKGKGGKGGKGDDKDCDDDDEIPTYGGKHAPGKSSSPGKSSPGKKHHSKPSHTSNPKHAKGHGGKGQDDDDEDDSDYTSSAVPAPTSAAHPSKGGKKKPTKGSKDSAPKSQKIAAGGPTDDEEDMDAGAGDEETDAGDDFTDDAGDDGSLDSSDMDSFADDDESDDSTM